MSKVCFYNLKSIDTNSTNGIKFTNGTNSGLTQLTRLVKLGNGAYFSASQVTNPV